MATGFIVYNAYHIFRPAFGEIMDEAPAGTCTDDIRALVEAVPGVVAIERCFVRKMGFEFFADLPVIVDGTISVPESHAITGAVKPTIKRVKPAVYHVLVHIEPDKECIKKCGAIRFLAERRFAPLPSRPVEK